MDDITEDWNDMIASAVHNGIVTACEVLDGDACNDTIDRIMDNYNVLVIDEEG